MLGHTFLFVSEAVRREWTIVVAAVISAGLAVWAWRMAPLFRWPRRRGRR